MNNRPDIANLGFSEAGWQKIEADYTENATPAFGRQERTDMAADWIKWEKGLMHKSEIARTARALWDGRLKPPTKAPGGAFLWTHEDIERASWLLRGRDASNTLPSTEEVAHG